jgi:hypothetical protein
MSMADLLGLGCWPLMALGGYLLFRAAYPGKPKPRAGAHGRKSNASTSDILLWAGILCIGAPMFLVIFIYHDETQLLSFETNVFYIAVGLAFLIPIREAMGKATVAAAAAGIGLIGLGGWYLIGDFLLPRQPVAGTITGARSAHGKAGPHYYAVVDGRSHPITADLFETLHPGDRIEALAGKASGTLFSIKATR